MADSVPGTTPVVDQRTPPRGVLPRSTQTWVMGGLAVAIVAIIVIAGHPEPSKRTTTTVNPSAMQAPSPERLKEYQALEMGTEFVRGVLEGHVDVQPGDNLMAKLSKAEILTDDDIIREIRDPAPD